MTVVREPAVAGQFYPEDPGELRTLVNRFIEDAACEEEAAPKALIAPPTLKGEFLIPPKGAARKRYYKKLEKIKRWLRKQQ